MSLVNKRYANYYNTRYRLTGHVFEKRYYDKIIEDKEGMLEVSRYIHRNPVEAKMVKQPQFYPWSSYHLFTQAHSTPPRFMNINNLLDYYTGTEQQKKEKYCQSMVDGEGIR
jgi:putative transposase